MMASQAPNHPTSNLFADGFTLLPTERTTAACRRRSGPRCRISTAAPGGVLIERPFTSGALAHKLKALGLRSRLRSSKISSTVLSIRRTFKVSTTRTAQRSSASRRSRRGSLQQAAKSRNFTAQKSNFLTELVNNVFELGNSPVHQTRRKSGLCAGDCPAHPSTRRSVACRISDRKHEMPSQIGPSTSPSPMPSSSPAHSEGK